MEVGIYRRRRKEQKESWLRNVLQKGTKNEVKKKPRKKVSTKEWKEGKNQNRIKDGWK